MVAMKNSAAWSVHFQTAAGKDVKLRRRDARAVLNQIVEIVYSEIGTCPNCKVFTENLDFTGQDETGALHWASFCPKCRQAWRTMLWPVPQEK